MRRGRSLGVALLADLLLGEPPSRLHPTVWMGRVISAGRARRVGSTPLPSLLQGALLVAGGAALAGIAARGAERALLRGRPVAREAALGLALKPALSLRALLEAGAAVERALARGDIVRARRLLAWHLVSRDTSELEPAEVAGAAIESLAENLSDGLVAPLLAFRAGGLGGAYLYRFVNTCDAMLGYRTPELEWFGKTAARLDDALNLLPARLSALLVVCAAGLLGADARGAARCALRDARVTASPNAGWPMAAMAGALGATLTKRQAYQLNPGAREPGADDLRRARHITAVAGALAVLLVGRA